MKLNSKTPLYALKSAVYQDFGVKIGNEFAKAIRRSNRIGCLVWTPEHLRSVQIDNEFDITSSRVKIGAVAFDAAEWNRRPESAT